MRRELLRKPVLVPLTAFPAVVVGGALETVSEGLGLIVCAGSFLAAALWMRANPLWVRDSFWRKHVGLREWLRHPFPWRRSAELPGEVQERRRATLRAIYCGALVIVGLVLLARNLA